MRVPRLKPIVRRLGFGLGAAGLGLGLYLGSLFLTGNVHAVVPGVLYRSAQPDAGDLEAYVKRYGIRTVVNLRGANPAKDWYREELATSERLGLAHLDFRMSAARELDPGQSEALIALLRDAPKPILVHCLSGSDRTGLASALFLAGVEKSGESAAEAQLSLRFGHLSLPFVSAWAMDESFERMEPRFGYVGS